VESPQSSDETINDLFGPVVLVMEKMASSDLLKYPFVLYYRIRIYIGLSRRKNFPSTTANTLHGSYCRD
jgi:hypothetical protein